MAILKEQYVMKNKDHQVNEIYKGLVDVGEVIYHAGSRVPASGFTAHDGKELCYVTKGEIVFGTKEGEVIVKEGEFHYLEKGVLHFCLNNGDSECRLIYILIKD